MGLLALVLLPLVGTAGAEPVAGAFHASGTTTLHGPHDLAWDTVGASIRPPEGGAGTVQLELHGARLQWINIPYTVTVARAGPVDRSHSGLGDEEVIVDRIVTGMVTVLLGDDGDEARLIPEGQSLRIPSNAAEATIHPAGAALNPPTKSTVTGRAFVQDTDIFLPLPHTHARTRDVTLHDARTAILVPAGTVWLPGEDEPREAGRSYNESRSLVDPTTGTGQHVYDTWVLLVTGGRLDATTHGLDWHLAATRVQGTLDGVARWQGIVGAVAVNGTRTPDDPTTLEVEGSLRVASDLRDAPLRWSLNGQAVRVELDNESFWQSTVAAAGLCVVAGIGLLAVTLRGLATLVLGRSTPSLLKASLDGPGRRRILQAIHAHQPVRPADLPRLTGMTRSTLRYHLRVLAAHDVLQEHVPPGEGRRAVTLMLNSGSHAFQATAIAGLVRDVPNAVPPASVRADEALGVAHGHPLRRALYDALLQHGPGDFQALHDRLREAGVEDDLQQPKASYHLSKLCASGAVVGHWVDARKVFEANLDPASVRTEQYHRYLGQQGALELVRALARGAMPRDDVLRHLQQRHGSRRTARRILQDLVAVAVLEPAPNPGQYRLTPPLLDIASTLRPDP